MGNCAGVYKYQSAYGLLVEPFYVFKTRYPNRAITYTLYSNTVVT